MLSNISRRKSSLSYLFLGLSVQLSPRPPGRLRNGEVSPLKHIFSPVGHLLEFSTISIPEEAIHSLREGGLQVSSALITDFISYHSPPTSSQLFCVHEARVQPQNPHSKPSISALSVQPPLKCSKAGFSVCRRIAPIASFQVFCFMLVIQTSLLPGDAEGPLSAIINASLSLEFIALPMQL